MKAVVIIEDKQKEILAAIAAVKEKLGVAGIGDDVAALKMGFALVEGVTLFFANNLGTAENYIKIAQKAHKELYILTDLMFPVYEGGHEQANGVSVILDAVEAGIPVTVCSDTDHHDVMFLPKLCHFLEKSRPGTKINLVLDSKDWKKAVDLMFHKPHSKRKTARSTPIT